MRAQSSLEYLITFGVALVIISIVGISLYKLGIFTPSRREMVSPQPTYFDILSFSIENDTLKIELINTRLGSSARIVKIEVSGDISGNSSFNQVLTQGSSRPFEINLLGHCSEGRFYTLDIKIYYQKETPTGFTSLESVDVGRIHVRCRRGTTGTTEAWLSGFDYRREVVITENSGNDLEEYQIVITIDTDTLISEGKMRSDCGDIRVTDSDKLSLLPYWVENCNDKNTKAWVKVPLIPENGGKKIYLYYGNPGAEDEGNISEVFSYREPRVVGYLVSDRLSNCNSKKVISLEDNNTICIGNDCVDLDKGETHTFTLSYRIGTPVKAKRVFHLDGACDNVDTISPISWAGKEFYYKSARGTNVWCILSPFGTTSVSIYDGGSIVFSGSVDTSGRCVGVDITNGNAVAIISSDLPILVQHYSAEYYDSRVLYPAKNGTLLGVPSKRLELGAGPDGANVIIYSSDGSTDSVSLGAYESYTKTYLHSYGAAPAVRLEADRLIGADQLADADGLETTTFLPTSELSFLYGSANPAGYIAIATVFSDAECCVYRGGTLLECRTATGSGGIYKICFGCGSTTTYVNAPWILKCTRDVFAYYENDAVDSDETNLLSYKQMRQYIYPEPTVSVGGEISR